MQNQTLINANLVESVMVALRLLEFMHSKFNHSLQLLINDRGKKQFCSTSGTGGTFAFTDPSNSTDVALGVWPYISTVLILFTTNFFVPGSIQRRLMNNYGKTIDQVHKKKESLF